MIPQVRLGRKSPSPQVCAENWGPVEECWWPCSPCHLSLSRWVFLYEKGYQSQDSIVSSVSVKLKGLTLTNESVLGPHIWDVVDYVFPPQVRSQSGWVRDLLLSQWLLFPMCWGADGSSAQAFHGANHDRVSLWWEGGCSCHKPPPVFSLEIIWYLGPTMAEEAHLRLPPKGSRFLWCLRSSISGRERGPPLSLGLVAL